jgi:hypothetical protein
MISVLRLLLAAGLALTGAAAAPLAAAETGPVIAPDAATVSVDFAKSRGPRFEAERYNNVSRPTTFTAARDADVQFFNEQGLHGSTYRVWIDAHLIHDEKTGAYNFALVEDYLADLSRLSDNLLIVMDTRVAVRDRGATPEQIKPVILTIMRELKRKYPAIRYVEAFNEPDHNLAKVLTPERLYDYYKVYYEAVNQINRELRPKVPLKVGGPALMQYNEPWLRAFLDRYAADPAKGKRLDFISYHAYGAFPLGDGNTGGPRAYHFYKGDPSEVAGQRASLEADLRARGLSPRIPSFITEIGIYPGPSFDNQADARPDYLINAAGVPSLLYWFMEQPQTVPFNWVLRHFGEERKDQLITRAANGQPMLVRANEDKPVPTGVFTPYGNALRMMAMLKDERVAAVSDALTGGKGVYAIATKDRGGAAVMLWNYQHTGTQSYRVNIDMGRLPANLRGKTLRQRLYRIDDKVSNYWANPATATLQMVSETTLVPMQDHRVTFELTPNALELVVLEPAPKAN